MDALGWQAGWAESPRHPGRRVITDLSDALMKQSRQPRGHAMQAPAILFIDDGRGYSPGRWRKNPVICETQRRRASLTVASALGQYRPRVLPALSCATISHAGLDGLALAARRFKRWHAKHSRCII